MSYAERLKKSNLHSLELRRLHADLTLCYKMLYSFTSICDLNMFFVRENDPRTRGHRMKLKATKPRLDTKRYYFAYRTAKVWNSLSNETVCAQSVLIFSSLLEKENLSRYLSTTYDY